MEQKTVWKVSQQPVAEVTSPLARKYFQKVTKTQGYAGSSVAIYHCLELKLTSNKTARSEQSS